MPVKTKTKQSETSYTPSLRRYYDESVRQFLMKEFNYKTPMQVPKIEKVILSAGVGEAIQNRKFLDSVVEELTSIAGQRAIKTKARKSISNFKVRAGMEIGVRVTLRSARMYDFLNRLIHIALPRIRDFRGLNANAFDGHGNYSLGIGEQIIFPEISYEKIEKISGFNIVIVTTASTDEEAKVLLTQLGFPFRSQN